MRPVPHISLLYLTLIVVLPASAGAVGLSGGAAHVCVLVLLCFIIVVLFDLIISLSRLVGVSMDSPELIRGTQGRELSVSLSLSNRGASLGKIRYGLECPEDFRHVGTLIKTLSNLPGATRRSVEILLLPLRRGRHYLVSLRMETNSRLGLWRIRRAFAMGTEVRIYPDLQGERRKLAAIFLMRSGHGMRAVRQMGKGRDFEQLREYQIGDDYGDVDWKATARRRSPVTRTYQIERTQEIYVVVDHSRLSAREIRRTVAGEGESPLLHDSLGGSEFVTTQLEKFLQCALILSAVAERQGDLFGFVSFADREDRFLRAGRGKAHYDRVRDALYNLEPLAVAPDYSQLMATLRQRLSQRALLVLLTDLSDPLGAEQILETLPLLSRQHLVLVNMVRPERAYPIFDSTHSPESVDDVYTRLAGHLQWTELREMGKKLQRIGVSLAMPEHEQLCAELVSQYLSVKQRQVI